MAKHSRVYVSADQSAILDALARHLADWFADPQDPFNRLARPAKRTCTLCGDTYRSMVSILADTGLCADCIQVPEAWLVDYLAQAVWQADCILYGLTDEDALLCAILGMEPKDYAARAYARRDV